jgi:AcrR family transcriptional regulator
VTRERLVDAAYAACLELGYDQVRVADVAARADVTAAAVYNHFAGKAELLFEAGRRALEELTAGAVGGLDEVRTAREIAAGYLAPKLAAERRLLLEIHSASERDPDLRAVLAEWHRQSARQLRPLLHDDDERDPVTTIKTFYLLLLGLCHVEQLEALRAPTRAVTREVGDLVDALFGAA